MTRRMMLPIAIAMTLVIAAAVGVLEAQGRGAQWMLLGSRTVTDGADHDTVTVTRAKGNFTAVKFEVLLKAVDFHRVVIHFANGEDQNVELRNTIKAGGQTRVIDIQGRDRVIRAIDFWYDAKTLGRGGKAVVRVIGRR